MKNFNNKLYKFKKRFYYFFKGKNKYKIHSEFLYNFYINCFEKVINKHIDVQLNEIIPYLENVGFKCFVKNINDIVSNKAYNSSNFNFNNSGSSSIGANNSNSFNNLNIVVIYNHINTSKHCFLAWRSISQNFNGLAVESINFGMLFYSDKFAKQFHVIK